MMDLGVFLGILGAFFVALDVSIAANVIWSVSNVLLIYRAYEMGDIDGAKMFLAYELVCLYGIFRYVRKQYKSRNLSS